MRPICRLVVFAVCAAASTAGFSQADGSPPPKIILKGGPEQSSCPVQFSAHRYGLTATLRETQNGPVSAYTQSLRLTFAGGSTSAIDHMTVRVYGTTAAPHVMPVGTAQASDVVSAPMQLTSKDGRFDAVQDITTSTVPLVTRIEITEIAYRDGTTWVEPSRNTCTAAPSLFVLVGAEAVAH